MDTIGDARLPLHFKGTPTPSRTSTNTEAQTTDLADLVTTYSPLLYRLVYSVVRSSSEAEDVVQEVFLRVLRYRARAAPPPFSIRASGSCASPGTSPSLTSSAHAVDHRLEQAERMQVVLSQLDRLPTPLDFDATLQETSTGAVLLSRVEQSEVGGETSLRNSEEPIIRQTRIEGDVTLVTGKPTNLGSLERIGSTRHLDVDVVLEPAS